MQSSIPENLPTNVNEEIALAVKRLQSECDHPLGDLNVLGIVRDGERYIFLFDDYHRTDTLRTLGRFAADPELKFTWYDAAVGSQRIRNMAPKETPTRRW